MLFLPTEPDKQSADLRHSNAVNRAALQKKNPLDGFVTD